VVNRQNSAALKREITNNQYRDSGWKDGRDAQGDDDDDLRVDIEGGRCLGVPDCVYQERDEDVHSANGCGEVEIDEELGPRRLSHETHRSQEEIHLVIPSPYTLTHPWKTSLN
jgi:hypothetical protein